MHSQISRIAVALRACRRPRTAYVSVGPPSRAEYDGAVVRRSDLQASSDRDQWQV